MLVKLAKAMCSKLCSIPNYLLAFFSICTKPLKKDESNQLRLGGFRCDGSPLPEIEVSGSELGRTGTGRSTLSSLFLSFFGHFTPSDFPISFRDTKNSIGQCCAMLSDVLTCVDDFHPSGRKEEQDLLEKAQMLARAYGDRVWLGRLRADSALMPVRSVFPDESHGAPAVK